MILQEITLGTGPDELRRQNALMFREDLPGMAGSMVRLWFDADPDLSQSLDAANTAARARARELLAACIAALEG